MISPLNRSAVGFTIACGVFLVGPLSVGGAVAHADVLGLGGGGGGNGIDVLGIDVLGGTAKKSSTVSGAAARTVSTAPSTRSVIIHAKPAAAQPQSAQPEAQAITPAASADVMSEAPAVAWSAPVAEAVPVAPPPAAPVAPPPAAPVAPEPVAGPVLVPPPPQGMAIPTTSKPQPGERMGPTDRHAPPTRLPDSFRAGYEEYLRTATYGDMLAAALPGVAGIAGFTLLGAYAGYRQAKALQEALLAPVPTSVLL